MITMAKDTKSYLFNDPVPTESATIFAIKTMVHRAILAIFRPRYVPGFRTPRAKRKISARLKISIMVPVKPVVNVVPLMIQAKSPIYTRLKKIWVTQKGTSTVLSQVFEQLTVEYVSMLDSEM
jgi:hypothetical protein